MFITVAPIYSPNVPPMSERKLLVWNKIYNIFNHDIMRKHLVGMKKMVNVDGTEQVQERKSQAVYQLMIGILRKSFWLWF